MGHGTARRGPFVGVHRSYIHTAILRILGAVAALVACCVLSSPAYAISGPICEALLCINSVDNGGPASCTTSKDPQCSFLPQCCDPAIAEFCPGTCSEPTNTPTASPTNTPESPATDTPLPTATHTHTYTATATFTNSPEPTSTDTPQPTATYTHTATATFTNSPEPTSTDTPLPRPTHTSTATATSTDSPEPTSTDTPQPTATHTHTATATFTNSPEPTSTDTPLPRPTHTSTATATSTNSPQPTSTDTPQPTATHTHTNTPVATSTHSPVPTSTDTPRPTSTSTSSATATHTPTFTATVSTTPTPGSTDTPSSPTPTPTANTTPTSAATLVTVAAECIQSNSDGTFTSYLSYNNLSGVELTIETDPISGSINSIVSTEEALIPPTVFAPGISRGSVIIRHRSSSFTWTVKAAGSEASSATVDSNTPPCKAVEPRASCTTKQVVLLGYNNPNSFPLVIPNGPDNFLSPGIANVPMIETFLPGRIEAARSVTLSTSSKSNSWTLQNQKVDLDSSSAACESAALTCANVYSADTIGNLDQVALELSAIAQRTAFALQKAKRKALERTSSSKQVRAHSLSRIETERRRAITRAKELEAEAYRLTIKLPKVSKTCVNAPSYCESIDRFDTFIALRRLYAYLLNMTKRQTNRLHFIEIGETMRNRAVVVKAKNLVKFGHSELDKLPRIATECT